MLNLTASRRGRHWACPPIFVKVNCLELDVNLGMSNYPLVNELDPFLASIRGGERFKELMERVKKEWEEFEV